MLRSPAPVPPSLPPLPIPREYQGDHAPLNSRHALAESPTYRRRSYSLFLECLLLRFCVVFYSQSSDSRHELWCIRRIFLFKYSLAYTQFQSALVDVCPNAQSKLDLSCCPLTRKKGGTVFSRRLMIVSGDVSPSRAASWNGGDLGETRKSDLIERC